MNGLIEKTVLALRELLLTDTELCIDSINRENMQRAQNNFRSNGRRKQLITDILELTDDQIKRTIKTYKYIYMEDSLERKTRQ